ncbi:MAG TPA: aminotransferase class III-fold pyridoxal phosphate-dependent enzyme, partial [Terriglobales bacterium]|nr:aminotransferase class III-fold pyridoxal phosphate-dependent enzyme [Terriglobales bacterium]
SNIATGLAHLLRGSKSFRSATSRLFGRLSTRTRAHSWWNRCKAKPASSLPEGFLKQAAELCRENRVLLVADEIQSGLGRTGKLFAYMHEGVRPDMLIVGKALAGGFYPVSAVLSSNEILGVYKPGDHGSTFGGNPLGCALARTALRVLVDEHLVERSAEMGAYFLKLLRTMRSPNVKEVRGIGLWIGIELHEAARPYCEALKEQGVLCKETHDRVIRIAPPLIINRDEIDWAFSRIRKVIEKI